MTTLSPSFVFSQVKAGRLQEHHTAYMRGYVRVNKPIVESYSGRFGEGFIIKNHSNRSTKYCVVTYYTKP